MENLFGKLYKFNYPSTSGMGSSVDYFIVTEDRLRKIIRKAIENYIFEGKPKDFSEDRLIGAWNDEKFCDSNDIEEQINDVIVKRLNTCSTYAGSNDLMEVPVSAVKEIKINSFSNTIFRTFNQFDCPRDIIVGNAKFTRLILDLEGLQDKYTFYDTGEKCRFFEFTSYSFKNVLENHFWWDWDELIKVEKRKIDNRGSEEDDYFKKLVCEAKATIEKYKDLTGMPNKYNTYLHYQDSHKYWKELFRSSWKSCNRNPLKVVYDRPLMPYTWFCEIDWNDDISRHYRYDELFHSGIDVDFLPFVLTDFTKELSDNEVNVFNAIDAVFGYD